MAPHESNPTSVDHSYYIVRIDRESKGPYTIQQLRTMWKAGRINKLTKYQHPGDTSWLSMSGLAFRLVEDGEAATAPGAKSRARYILLGVFFGTIGAHNFYANRFIRGSLQSLLTLSTIWFRYAILAAWLWSLIEVMVEKKDGGGEPMS